MKTYQTIYSKPDVQKDGYCLIAQPLQDGVVFQKNQPIRFFAKVTKDGLTCSQGQIIAYFKFNAKNMIYHQIFNLTNGTADIEFICEQAGFGILFVQYHLNDIEIVEQLRGIAISPEEIKKSYPRPLDFDQFWNSKKSVFSKPIHPTYIKIDKNSHPHLHKFSHKNLLEKNLSELEIHDVQIPFLEKGVSGILTRPKIRKAKSLAAILYLHGGGVRPCDPSNFVDRIKPDMMILDINAHGIPNDKEESWYKEIGETGELVEYFYKGRNDKNEYYFLNMYLRVKRALDFLKSLPEWDQKTLITFGGSQGAAQAYAGAYLDDQVSAIVGQIPAYGDLTGFLCDRTVNFGDWLKMEPRGKVPKNILEVAPYFDTANFLTKFNGQAFFCMGLLDLGSTPMTNFVPIKQCPAQSTIIFQADCYHSVCEQGQNLTWQFIYDHIKRNKTNS